MYLNLKLIKQNIFSKALLFSCLSLCVFLNINNSIAQESTPRVEGNQVFLPAVKVGNKIFNVEFDMSQTPEGLEIILTDFFEIAGPAPDNASIFSNNILNIPFIEVGTSNFIAEFELIDSELFRFRLTFAEVIMDEPDSPSASCNMDVDITNGPDEPTITSGWAVPAVQFDFLLDGGPGADGIPPLETPRFHSDFTRAFIAPNQLVVGVKIGNDIRAYPHNILDWHEVVNDSFSVNGEDKMMTLSYCPLTGSAVLWDSFVESANPTFGTSGLLFNSNLILYDRETRSLWSQMLEQSISGLEILKVPEKIQVVETTWLTWSSMYPQTKVLDQNTGFSRDYFRYPYGSYRTDSSLLFPVNNSFDGRLHRKERVAGINVGDASKVYPISRFTDGIEVVNDVVGNMPVVVAVSSSDNFGVIFNRRLNDCTELNFEPVQNQLPVVMRDNEGNEWDIFGVAQSGPRTGEQLQKTNSYIAYWFAWTAFFPNAEIFQ